MTDAAPPPLPAGPPSPQPTGWIAATCILGAAVLGLTATLVIRGASSDAVGESAEGSAQAACDLLGQVPEDGFEMTSDDEDEDGYPEGLARLGVAETLATLATSQGGDYDDLQEAIRKPRVVVNEQFKATGDDFVDALADARSACADEGF